MTDRMTKMVNGLLPDGTLIRACEVTFDYLEKQDDRIEKLKAALREIGRTFLAEVKSKPEQWTSKQSLLLSHEQAVEVHEELGRRILIARKALEGKDD